MLERGRVLAARGCGLLYCCLGYEHFAVSRHSGHPGPLPAVGYARLNISSSFVKIPYLCDTNMCLFGSVGNEACPRLRGSVAGVCLTITAIDKTMCQLYRNRCRNLSASCVILNIKWRIEMRRIGGLGGYLHSWDLRHTRQYRSPNTSSGRPEERRRSLKPHLLALYTFRLTGENFCRWYGSVNKGPHGFKAPNLI